ncbi:MAG: hypothetical protein V7693_16120 [Halopseudomonas sabulinigri]
MQQISETEFNAVLKTADKENDERVSVGLEPQAVTTKNYGGMTGAGSLVEYHFAGSMFGFIQDGAYYSNGL